MPTEPAAAPPHGRETVEHPYDRQMTFLDHLGSSWPSAEAQRVRQSSKAHMADSRNRWEDRPQLVKLAPEMYSGARSATQDPNGQRGGQRAAAAAAAKADAKGAVTKGYERRIS